MCSEAFQGLRGLYPRMHERIRGLPPTNWWVITGPPHSGKTSLIDNLSFNGYRTVPEAARVLIDQEMSQGKTIKEIRAGEAGFQQRVFALKCQLEPTIPKSELIFFDRGKIGDDMAYWVNAINYHSDVTEVMSFYWGLVMGSEQKYRYAGIFLLDRLPSYEQDYARTEDEEEALRITDLLRHYYEEAMGYPIINVPVLQVNERAQFVLEHVNAASI